MAGQQIASGLFAAADGSWGDAAGMTIIDDRDWESYDYDILDLCSDARRADLADAIDSWVKEGRPELDYDQEKESIDEVLLRLYQGY